MFLVTQTGTSRFSARVQRRRSAGVQPGEQSADNQTVQIMYVETCPDCDCALVRAETGETKPSRLMADCGGCTCHTPWQTGQAAAARA
jgi:hypothetical protein